MESAGPGPAGFADGDLQMHEAYGILARTYSYSLSYPYVAKCHSYSASAVHVLGSINFDRVRVQGETHIVFAIVIVVVIEGFPDYDCDYDNENDEDPGRTSTNRW